MSIRKGEPQVPEFDISVESSIGDVDAAAWDSLAGDHTFLGHGWLRTIEQTAIHPTLHRYLKVRAAGRLVAATPLRIEGDVERRTDVAAVLLGDLARAVPPMRSLVYPALTCGSGVGHGSPILLDQNLDANARTRVLGLVVERVLEEGRAARAIVRMRNVPSESHAEIAALDAAGCIRTRELPNSLLDVAWDSYDAYLAYLRGLHPGAAQSARNEHNRGRRAGLVIEPVADVAAVEDVLHALADAHFRRRNHRPFPYRRGFFTLLQQCLGARMTILLATLQGSPVGMVVMVFGGGDAYLPFVGVDPVAGRASAAYFNLVFNMPIREAIGRRLRRLYFGRMLYPMKIRRGCRLTREDMFVHNSFAVRHATLRPLLSLRSWAMDLRLRRQTGISVGGRQ